MNNFEKVIWLEALRRTREKYKQAHLIGKHWRIKREIIHHTKKCEFCKIVGYSFIGTPKCKRCIVYTSGIGDTNYGLPCINIITESVRKKSTQPIYEIIDKLEDHLQ